MKKKIVFYSIMLSIPVLLIVLLEMSLRIYNYGYDLSLFQKSKEYEGYYRINADIAKRFFLKSNGTAPTNDIFLINKPDTCYRIFVMGCSTTAGFPYQVSVAFPRILYFRLQEAFPHKRIEVINTAMSAINSYTQADFIDEILEMNPDAILIYTGHNEFYGALGVGSVENGGNARWLKKIHLCLIKYRTYQLIQRMVAGIQKAMSQEQPTYGTLMTRIVKNKSIDYKSDVYNAGIEQFRVNMEEVVSKITNARIPLLFSDVVSNYKMPPFKSSATGKFEPANSVFAYACRLEKEGRFDEARKKYYLAKDLDVIRFRAPEELNKVIYDICNKYKVPVPEMQKVFNNLSPNGITGYNLMLEHLHPNIDGYFLMADVFFNELKKNKFIADEWDTARIKSSAYYRSNWGFTEFDSLHAELTIKSLEGGWPFKPDSAENNFLEIYKPVSFEDSLAWSGLHGDTISLDDKHILLAQKYYEKGQYIKAFKEYYSMVKKYPYLPDGYYYALRYLDKAGEYKKGLDLMLSLPDKEKYYSACMKIGKLCCKLNQPGNGIEYYEKIRKITPAGNELQYMLTSLYEAYLQAGNQTGADNIIKEIKSINPDFQPKTSNSQANLVYVGEKVKPYIDKAIVFIQQKRFEEALQLLFDAQKIDETSIANHLIGNILLKKGDPRALYYLEKVHATEPENQNLLKNLFAIYLQNKDFEKASKILEEYKLITDDYDLIKKLIALLEKEKNRQN